MLSVVRFLLLSLLLFSYIMGYCTVDKGRVVENKLYEGEGFLNHNEYGNAYRCFYDFIAQQADTVAYAMACMHVGELFVEKYGYAIAIDYYTKGLDKLAGSHIPLEANLLMHISGAYYDQQKYDHAYTYFCQALERYKQVGDKKNIAAAYNNIGECFRYKGEWEEAETFYQRSIALNSAYGYWVQQAINYSNLGKVMLDSGRLGKVLGYYKKSDSLFVLAGYDDKLAMSQIRYGEFFQATASLALAREHYTKALLLLTDSDDIASLSVIHRGLADVLSRQGDDAQACIHLNEYIALRQRAFNDDIMRQRTAFKTLLETERQAQEISRLMDQAKLEERIKRNQMFFLSGIVIVLAGLLFLLYYLFRYKNRSYRQKNLLLEQQNELNRLENQNLLTEKRELEAHDRIKELEHERLLQDLEHRSRELASYSMHMISKNEMLSHFRNRLAKSEGQAREVVAQELRKMIHEIDSNVRLDHDWENFKKHFVEVHGDVFTRLKQRYPDLTSEEMKLCAYLRINLSSKEIAQILNITQVAVNKRRNRMRKKMNLSPEDNLIDHIVQL